jgi:DNA-binding response OmpR family regulator
VYHAPCPPEPPQDGPNLSGHRIQRYDAQRTLVVDGRLIRFTPTEYRLLLLLLEPGDHRVSFARLVQGAFSCTVDASTLHMLEYHIDHIRSKVRPVGLDVYRIVRYGYLLAADNA